MLEHVAAKHATGAHVDKALSNVGVADIAADVDAISIRNIAVDDQDAASAQGSVDLAIDVRLENSSEMPSCRPQLQHRRNFVRLEPPELMAYPGGFFASHWRPSKPHKPN